MYIPYKFKIEDLQEIKDFARSVRAADLVTVDGSGLPVATLMPFVWECENISEGHYGKLVMHMAKANPQWQEITPETKALAIIRGPQAYISPSNYGNKLTDHKVVPTWNYQTLHLSGRVEVSDDVELMRQIVSDLSNFHESSREKPWDVADTDPRYMELNLAQIVAVILHVEKVEAKYKLSQNRSAEDQERVAQDLAASTYLGESAIAEAMKRNLDISQA
jgi:transcriptional regulator